MSNNNKRDDAKRNDAKRDDAKRDDDKRDDDKRGDHKWGDDKRGDDKRHDDKRHDDKGDDGNGGDGKLGDGKTVVLTFDDGPAPIGALKDILKTLHREDIKAEFFVIGSEVEENPQKTKMIVREGHEIQNHSWSHVNLATASEEQVRLELSQTQDVIEDVTGVTATKVRPPFGAGGFEGNIDPELAAVAKELDLSIVTWDIDSRDTLLPQGPGPEKYSDIENQFLQQPDKTEYDILVHVNEGTAAQLPAFIEQLSEWGFTFGEPEIF
ncbi:peptidoglycan/xylan/chitin deacetylase (PgdA/CDA1 family) [Nitrosospira sp. Nsp2]|uniref:polysaccharide deacetylase family protein n=1 Tax=Nitrosospira sp. Nsp2 TaxID=136548 RepID=UPI000D469B20|nr:polysaccharide deacetylase family protein [Nitrosospira sp. Nsp2]PTR16008.1 peptidoglycan/xylan/chitin deacetylase (PgdA/CDA1 family) [Nitrosospira sp. Nsp2]